jgi:hypothetical protein
VHIAKYTLCFQRQDPVCHQLAFPLCDPRHVAADRTRPHFCHVIISTLRAGPTFFVGFGSGDHAMWIVLATMVSLSALALLAACEDKSDNMP